MELRLCVEPRYQMYGATNPGSQLWREKNNFDEKCHAVVYCERVRFFA